LMRALNDLEKFLVQYTKPKMKTLLRFFNMDQVSDCILAFYRYKQNSNTGSLLFSFYLSDRQKDTDTIQQSRQFSQYC